MKHEGSTFLSGAAGTTDFFFFAKERDELAEEDTPNSSFFVYDEDDGDEAWRKYDEIVHWPAIAMATVKPAGQSRLVVAMGPNGDVWELDARSTDERVRRIADAGNVRKLATIGDDIYACGMNRIVLQRRAFARWDSLGPGPQAGDPAIVGFEDLGGFGEHELYAVGWGGEIWWRDAGTWRRADSPTNANLTALTIGADGMVYVVGHDGVLLKGRRDQWALVDTGRRENLRDVATLDGRVYAASDFALFWLDDAGLVPESDFADGPPATCLHLLEAPDGLVSLGQKDVFVKRSGAPWERLV
ncbi:MAG: hypothetical protein EOO26_00780 [Comamonadaceae bacterium]|nr:MAG: hypothetical protein EOO26_00780 [Comamonadaceae bacterium]